MTNATSLRGRLTGLPDRVIWWAAFAVVAALGLLWAVSSPLMSVPDEPNHAIKAVALAHGDLTGRDVTTRSDDPRVVSGTLTYFIQDRTWDLLSARAGCYAFQPDRPAGCMVVVAEDRRPTEISTYAGNYPPLYYALVGWPSRLFDPHIALFAMRGISVLIGAALMASGLSSAVRGPGAGRSAGGLMAGAALAITPMTPFLMGAINPSGVEIAAAFCLWLTSLALAVGTGPPPTRLLVRFVVALLLLTACRPLSPAFAAFIIVSVVAMTLTRARLAELWADRRTRIAAGASVAVVVLAVGVVVATGAINSFSGSAQPGLTHIDAALGSLDRTWSRTEEMVGRFGWRETYLPDALLHVWTGAIVLLALVALVVGTARQRVFLVLTTVGFLALPVLSETLKAPSLGYIWQARYSIPLAIGLPLLSGWIVGASGRLKRGQLDALVMVCAVGAGTGLAIAHAIWMRRNIVGVDHPVLSYLSGSGWVPPVPATLLGLGSIGVSIAWALLLITLARQRTDARSDDLPEPQDRFAPDGRDVSVLHAERAI